MFAYHHPIFVVMAVAVLAPLLAEIPIGARVPVAVFEVMLGIIIGPHLLGWIDTSPFLSVMQSSGLAAMLFMAGMEIDFAMIRGRPLTLGLIGWAVSAVLAFATVGLLHIIPGVQAPMMVTIALTTTSLGVLLPMLRDGGLLEAPFGRLLIAAGTIGEVAPIVAVSLALSTLYSTWQEFGLLLVFLAVVASAAAVGVGARPPRLLALLSRTMRASSQLPVRLAIFLLAAMFVLSEEWGFEGILGAFAAGMVVGLATRGEEGESFRVKMDAVAFGWLMPFFFVGTGIQFNVGALTRNVETMVLVPTFLMLLLLVRGIPVLLYRKELGPSKRLPFALAASVASLGLIVVITEIGLRAKNMNPDVAQALVAAALLSLLLFPTFAGALISRHAPMPERTQSHATR